MRSQPTSFSTLPIVLGFACLFNFFFWQEKLGVNLFLFSSLLIGFVFLTNQKARASRQLLFTGLGSFLTAILVLVHNSGTAKLIHLLSLFVFFGFAHLPELRTMGNALLSSLQGYASLGRSIKREWTQFKQFSPQLSIFSSYLKLTIVPFLVLIIFGGLFYFANAPFASLVNSLGEYIGQAFVNFSPFRIAFFLFGLLFLSGLILPHNTFGLLAKEQTKSDQLVRKKPSYKRAFSFLGLKKEYRTGMLLVGMINLLLLVNNILDIQHVWFNFEPQSHVVLRQYVHEGTYFLIASIIFSMGIMLYFFRGNINFLKGSRPLRILSYAWIVQNAILVLSVGMRNCHYIGQYGLAYKRIGVFFFLFLTLFGLFSLYLKIRDRMSTFYLFKTNAWALYATMMVLSMVNWDMAIAKFNFQHYEKTQQLDTDFLLTLSNKSLPLLMEHQALFPVPANLAQKKADFLKEQETYSWLSWNLADAQAMKYVTRK
ncbi:MAG: DUF4173 domain-containing protein [Bacteroidota bacterium]